ncbi:MAG: hypothetical protein AAF791_13160, partial [Bacteroidota bacterium]
MSLRFWMILLVAVGLTEAADAQKSAAVLAAEQHLRSFTTETAFAGDDLADLFASDQYDDRRSGATMVYLVQRHNGIEIHGAIAPVAVLPSGKTIGLSPRRYVSGLAGRAVAQEPQIAPEAAESAAFEHTRGLDTHSHDHGGTPIRSDDPALDGHDHEAVTPRSLVPPRLVYQPTPDGALRLAWSVQYETVGGPMEMWAVRVDALTGEVLAADDLV